MPELPEVETIRLGLQGLLVGQQIKSVNFDWPKSFPNDPKLTNEQVIGAKIDSVDRRAKVLLIGLSTGYSLMIHLKMTGQLVFVGRKMKNENGKKAAPGRFGGGHPTDSLIGKLPDKSTRVTFELTRGKLYFNDQRKFGWIRLVPTKDLLTTDRFLSKLGPEPLEDSYTFDLFKAAVQRRSKTSIKAAILDQSVVAGVGNIYADEGLFAARIHPATKVADVSVIKLRRLYEALREVMKLSISLGGSSDRNYVDAEGKRGSYLKFAKVFRREGQPCIGCKGEVSKIRVAGRGTHICTSCQRQVKSKKDKG